MKVKKSSNTELPRPQTTLGVVTLILLFPLSLWASDNTTLSTCAEIQDDHGRLTCFDALTRKPKNTTQAATAVISTAGSNPATEKTKLVMSTSLSNRWELEAESKRGTWSFRAHKPNYFLLGRYTDRVNYQPYEKYFTATNDPSIGLDDVEAKFQLSFKVKAAENLFNKNNDLWVGYTQQNHWQLYNSGISAPFRETNYEPEMFVSIPTHYDALGLKGRFINLGLVHQSNGQSNLLSRSWNRVYAQFGFEYQDKFNLTFKPWYRIPEKSESDDNPNITDYLGDFETVASYRLGKNTFSALGRSTFNFERGFLQLDWTYPLQENLKAYVQFTTGYGESLIDYKHHQNTLGIGIMLTDWM